MTTHVPPPRTYAERHAEALDVMRTLSGRDDVDRVADGMVRRYGALGSAGMDCVGGDLWSRPQLSRRDRSLVVIAFLATQGAEDELSLHVKAGLRHGLTREEVDEILLHASGYAGFPMMMAASRVVAGVWCELDGVDRLPPRAGMEQLDDIERRRRAVDVMRTVTRGASSTDPDEALAGMIDRLGGVGELAMNFFGEVWARPQLSRRDRSLVTIAILGFLSKEQELVIHIPAAIEHGLSREEIEEVFVQLCVYGGFPRAVEAVRLAKKLWQKADGTV